MLLDAMMLGSLLSVRESAPSVQQSSSPTVAKESTLNDIMLDAIQVWIDAS
jgi:hypothetical protein